MGNIRIVAEIRVKPEFRDELMPHFKALVEGSRAETGNRLYDLTESLEIPGHFFVIEDWASERAIEEHNATRHFNDFGAAIEGKTIKFAVTQLKTVF